MSNSWRSNGWHWQVLKWIATSHVFESLEAILLYHFVLAHLEKVFVLLLLSNKCRRLSIVRNIRWIINHVLIWFDIALVPIAAKYLTCMWRHILICISHWVCRPNPVWLILLLHILNRPFPILLDFGETRNDPRILLQLWHVSKTDIGLLVTFLRAQLHFSCFWPLNLDEMNVVLVLHLVIGFESCLIGLLLLQSHIGRDRNAWACDWKLRMIRLILLKSRIGCDGYRRHLVSCLSCTGSLLHRAFQLSFLCSNFLHTECIL